MRCSRAAAPGKMPVEGRRALDGLTARRRIANDCSTPLVAWDHPGQIVLGDTMAMDSVRLVLVNWPSQSTNEASRYEASSLT